MLGIPVKDVTPGCRGMPYLNTDLYLFILVDIQLMKRKKEEKWSHPLMVIVNITPMEIG